MSTKDRLSLAIILLLLLYIALNTMRMYVVD